MGQLVVIPEVVASNTNNMNNTSPVVYGIAHTPQKETVKQISMSLAQVFNMYLHEGIVL